MQYSVLYVCCTFICISRVSLIVGSIICTCTSTYIFIRIDCLFNRTDNIFLLHWLYFFICENNLSINLYRSYIHILHGRSWSSAQTKIWSHINCTDNSTLSLHIICNIVCGRFPVNLHRHSKNNCAVFYITSVKSITRIAYTEHIYCLQDVWNVVGIDVIDVQYIE